MVIFLGINRNYLIKLVYLDRTEGVSTTKIKEDLGLQKPIQGVNQIPSPNK